MDKLPHKIKSRIILRRRIGEEGFQEIFNISVSLHGKSAKEEEEEEEEEEVVIDTTVQEKNSTFPTDSKLHVKIIVKCRSIAKKEGFSLRRSFTRELPDLLRTIRFEHNKKATHKRSRAVYLCNHSFFVNTNGYAAPWVANEHENVYEQ